MDDYLQRITAFAIGIGFSLLAKRYWWGPDVREKGL
jgi:hypothetical protein